MHAAILTVAKKLSNEFNLTLSFSPLSSQHLLSTEITTLPHASKQQSILKFHSCWCLFICRYTQVQDVIFYIHIFTRQVYSWRPEPTAFVSINAVTPQKAPTAQWQESSPLGSGTFQVSQGSKGEAHTKAPESLIFIKIIIQASCSAKAENIQGMCLLPALNIRSLNKNRWVVFGNWKQPDPVLRTTEKQDLSKIPTNTWNSEGTPDSTRERTQASRHLDFSLGYPEQETQSA